MLYMNNLIYLAYKIVANKRRWPDDDDDKQIAPPTKKLRRSGRLRKTAASGNQGALAGNGLGSSHTQGRRKSYRLNAAIRG